MPTPTNLIRNFCIIAHIDHGKSTLADQFLLKSGAVSQRDIKAQTLDSMDLERERGITIRMHPVTIFHEHNGQKYELNLIDTPGHVDFNYEVSRSLAACEGAILLVDAFQGVQAQTVANGFLAIEANLKLVPTLNKIDLPHARPEFVIGEMEQAMLVEDPDAVMKVSAKAGIGIEELMGAVIDQVPPPSGDIAAPLKALIYNSHFDTYKGVVVYIRMIDGTLKPGQRIKMMRAGREFVVTEMGQFRPEPTKIDELGAGQVGYFTANIKTIDDVGIGDTVTDAFNPTAEPMSGYKEPKPMVYSGLYPVNNNEFEDLREALGKLKLNDSSFTYVPEVSDGLGFGFRCGFLGMLHREIIQQRLERDCELNLVQTAPNVTYEIEKTNGEVIHVHGPQDVPDGGGIEEFREPIVKISFLIPSTNIGRVPQPAARHSRVRDAARGGDLRPLRQAEVVHARLRHDGLRGDRLPRRGPRAHGHPRPRQPRRCAVDHRPQDERRPPRPESAGAAPQGNQPAHVRGGLAGRDRRQDHRARDDRGDEEGRDGEVLWRRHLAEAEALEQAGRGEEADEGDRPGGGPAGGVPGGAGR
jgi:GTP-binding protein LepA